MDPNQFIESLKIMNQYEMVNPYNSVIDLTQQESTLSLDQMIQVNRPGRGETDIQKVPLCGGICLFRKESIMRIAGWNEDFWSWGGEDDFQSIKVKQLLNYTELQAKCYHLYHEKAQPDMKWYQRNLQILQKTANVSKEQLEKLILNQLPKIGMKNKCDNF